MSNKNNKEPYFYLQLIAAVAFTIMSIVELLMKDKRKCIMLGIVALIFLGMTLKSLGIGRKH